MARTVYVVEFERFPGVVKIGCTANLKERCKGLKVEYRSPVTVIASVDGEFKQEHELHRRFAASKAIEYGTEFFYRTAEINAYIRDLLPVEISERHYFKSRVPALIGAKMVELRRYVSAKEVREATGIPKSDFYQWVRDDALMDGITDTEAGAFLKFFNCTLNDLVVIVPAEAA